MGVIKVISEDECAECDEHILIFLKDDGTVHVSFPADAELWWTHYFLNTDRDGNKFMDSKGCYEDDILIRSLNSLHFADEVVILPA
jgi:hypothetical protein